MQPFHLLLAIFAAAALAAFVLLMRWERRTFAAHGKAHAWLIVRLASIPIAACVAALVLLPARRASGMMGLAVFYALLLTLAPLAWFGAHWAVGRLVRPAMPFGESARIAGSPVVFALVAAGIAQTLQPFAWSLARAMGQA